MLATSKLDFFLLRAEAKSQATNLLLQLAKPRLARIRQIKCGASRSCRCECRCLTGAMLK